MFGIGKLRNFRNYHIINGYRDLRNTKYKGIKSYSEWDCGVVNLDAPGLPLVHVERFYSYTS